MERAAEHATHSIDIAGAPTLSCSSTWHCLLLLCAREAEAPTSLAADTIFFVENTLNMLETMDHTVPYILSDHIW